jgi:methyl-accepting chemotaxis protein
MNLKSIRFRLTALFVVLISAVLLTTGAITYTLSKAEREAAVQRQAQATLARLGSSLPAPLWSFDKAQVQTILNGQTAELSAAPPSHDQKLAVPLSFTEGGKANAVGEAEVYLSYADVRRALRQDLLAMVLQIVLALVVLVVALTLSLRSIVLAPLARFAQAMRDISEGEGDLTKRLPESDVAEFKDLSVAFNAFMARMQDVVGRIRQGSDSIALASREIAAGNQDLSQRTEEQAAVLQQTAASMGDLNHAVQRNLEHSAQAASMAAEARDVAQRGGEAVNRVVGTMSSIHSSSKKVVDIISVIDGIAFQTNILALNAAVEAARAGEQGRGFAVVASEVRSLAQRSASAAREISTLIKQSVEQVDAGSSLVQAAGSTMNEIVSAVERVSQLMTDMQSATHSQARGIDQITDAVKQMDATTQKNAALVEQAAAAAESMQEQSQSLNSAVGSFRIALA